MVCKRVKVWCTYGIQLKVVYTVWGIYHANYDIFHAIKVDNDSEVCMDWTSGWRGPLLFSTVQTSHFQVEVAQTIWHDATKITATLALWTGTERTATLESWYCPRHICCWHLIISLDDSANSIQVDICFCGSGNFTSSEPKNKVPINWLFIINCKYFPKIGSAGARYRICFSGTG